jgi:hypothetical protein
MEQAQEQGWRYIIAAVFTFKSGDTTNTPLRICDTESGARDSHSDLTGFISQMPSSYREVLGMLGIASLGATILKVPGDDIRVIQPPTGNLIIPR